MTSATRKVVTPAAIVAACIASVYSASAQLWNPGDILVSESTYQDVGQAAAITIGQALPGGGNAVATGAFPSVFQNATPDSSFGITAPIALQNLTQGTLTPIPTSSMVTSFSSKSELGLNFSPDGGTLSFMGYADSNVGDLDISNSNTPGNQDSHNSDSATATARAVATLNASGIQSLAVTPVNAYSGNNGRAAILVNNVNGTGENDVFMVGNAGNSSVKPEPGNIISDTGVQMVSVGGGPNTTVVGPQLGTPGATKGNQYGFSVTSLGYAGDNSGKDDNFRGETIFNNTLYVTKGSGNNGIDTVYQVGATGSLPTLGTAGTTTTSVLPGFNTALASSFATGGYHPFGLFFANANTLYVADEGDGIYGDQLTSTDPNAGLEKWSLVNGTWQLDYTLRNGLASTYSVSGYNNPNGSPISVSTDGLRTLAGKVNADGTVTFYAVTSTVDNANPAVDFGADPNQLVQITDNLAATTLPGSEQFSVLESAGEAQVLRGVAIAPAVVPEPGTMFAGAGALVMAAGRVLRKRKN